MASRNRCSGTAVAECSWPKALDLRRYGEAAPLVHGIARSLGRKVVLLDVVGHHAALAHTVSLTYFSYSQWLDRSGAPAQGEWQSKPP